MEQYFSLTYNSYSVIELVSIPWYDYSFTSISFIRITEIKAESD